MISDGAAEAIKEDNVERYLKHELRLRMDEEFDCYEVDVSEESTA